MGQFVSRRRAIWLHLRGGERSAILNIHLSDGSDLKVLRTLREREATTGIVVFTSVSVSTVFEARIKLSAEFVFDKSTEFEHVKAAVQRLAARRPLL